MAATNNGLAELLALNAAMEASGHIRDADEEEPRLACLIFDSTLTAVHKSPAGLGLPTIVLHTTSAACFRMARSYDMLLDKGYLPSTGSAVWHQ